MLARLIYFLLFPIFFLRASLEENQSKVSNDPIPVWVKKCDFLLDPPMRFSERHLQHLLYDRQCHWEKDEIFLHRATRILDEIGTEEISKVSFLFDPSYEKIVVHFMQLHREEQIIDILPSVRSRLIQQEDKLESGIYTGKLSLVYFLEDIREGDVVEYACSFVGANPAFSSYHDDFIYLQRNEPHEKIYQRLLIDQDKPFFMKNFNSVREPKISIVEGNLKEWVWEVYESLPYVSEPDQPQWYLPYEYIQVSQYANWYVGIQQMIPLYSLPNDFEEQIKVEMIKLVDSWKASTLIKSERALLAIRFVQDKIRYQGFEDGIGSIKPSNPNMTLKRRYGDCKDKTLLLQIFLFLMDIKSAPVLVDTRKTKTLSEFLPAISNLFNHVVLRVEIEGNYYWIDPTRTLQGGNLDDCYFPEYEWGLVISQESRELTPIPHLSQKPIEILTSIAVRSPELAEAKTTIFFHGVKADMKRNELKRKGYKNFSENYLHVLQRGNRQQVFTAPLSLSDDREKNVFALSADYQIPSLNHSGKISVTPYIFSDFLDKSVKSNRQSPYSLDFPRWVKEQIQIENPYMKGSVDFTEKIHEHESFLYKSTTKADEQQISFYFEIKHLQDYVSANSIKDYQRFINKIINENK